VGQFETGVDTSETRRSP